MTRTGCCTTLDLICGVHGIIELIQLLLELSG